jgi:uncharacterized protein
MRADQVPPKHQANNAVDSVPAEYEAWRNARWDEVAGSNGKAKVVANGKVIGRGPHLIPGVPGRWSTTEAGALTVTATADDGVTVDGDAVIGTVGVPSGSTLGFPGGRVGFAGGADGAYGLVVMDHEAVTRSGLSRIDTYPYDPAWVFEGEYRAAPEGRRIEVGRLTNPRSTEAILAPVDLAVTIDGTEYVLSVLEDMPGQRLVVFTDETNGTGTPGIGRWLVLPLLEPGSTLTVDFNQATLSHHHLVPTVFTCPLSPPGNHLPVRVEAGERALVHGPSTSYHPRQIDAIESMRYDVVRQFSRPDEVLQQHVVNVATKDGMRGQVHAAGYFRFEGGLITRIEEYANFVPGDDDAAA